MLGENEILVTRFEDLMTAAEFSLEGASGKELVAALDRLSLSLRRFGVGVEPNEDDAEASLSSRVPQSVCSGSGATLMG